MGAVPVELATRRAAPKCFVGASGAGWEQRLDLALDHVAKGPVAGRAPCPGMQRWNEPVQHLSQLCLWQLVVDVRSPTHGTAVEQATIASQQDALLGQRQLDQRLVRGFRVVGGVQAEQPQ